MNSLPTLSLFNLLSEFTISVNVSLNIFSESAIFLIKSIELVFIRLSIDSKFSLSNILSTPESFVIVLSSLIMSFLTNSSALVISPLSSTLDLIKLSKRNASSSVLLKSFIVFNITSTCALLKSLNSFMFNIWSFKSIDLGPLIDFIKSALIDIAVLRSFCVSINVFWLISLTCLNDSPSVDKSNSSLIADLTLSSLNICI